MNDGALDGATWVTGHAGGALDFNGTSRVLVPHAASLDTATTAMTFATWLFDEDPATNGPNRRILQFESVWEVKLAGGAPQLGDQTSSRYGLLTQKVPLMEWHHVAFVFDGGALTGYLDGVPAGWDMNFFTDTQPLPVGTEGVALGGTLPGDPSASCICRMDDVRLYHRALTAAEIAALAH
jgi:hypothetical protein